MKESMSRIEQKLDTAISNSVMASATTGSSSKLLPESETPPSPEVYNGVVLTDIHCLANSPQKYARKVMRNISLKKKWLQGFTRRLAQPPSLSCHPTDAESSGVSSAFSRF
jgi:hypothetical protein